MANNYTSASFEIPVTDAVLANERMTALANWFDDAPTMMRGDVGLAESCANHGGGSAFRLFGDKVVAIETRLHPYREVGNGFGFTWEAYLDRDALSYGGANGRLWIAHDESIDLETAVDIAITMLDLDENEDVFTAEWACTCSKPRVGEFCGGAVAFSRYGSDWMNTAEMATKLTSRRIAADLAYKISSDYQLLRSRSDGKTSSSKLVD